MRIDVVIRQKVNVVVGLPLAEQASPYATLFHYLNLANPKYIVTPPDVYPRLPFGLAFGLGRQLCSDSNPVYVNMFMPSEFNQCRLFDCLSEMAASYMT